MWPMQPRRDTELSPLGKFFAEIAERIDALEREVGELKSRESGNGRPLPAE